MRRGPINRTRRKNLPLRIIIPLVFLVIGVGAAYSLVAGDKKPDPRPEPVIIRPGPRPPITPEGQDEGSVDGFTGILPSGDVLSVGPVDSNSNTVAAPRDDQFTNARVAAYKVSSAALKKTVAQYSKARSNQCVGEITVRTDDTPLNVRSGPSTGNPVLTKVPKGSKQNVLLWAQDSASQSARWFLLVDDRTKTVKGWVSGEYCDSTGVVFAN